MLHAAALAWQPCDDEISHPMRGSVVAVLGDFVFYVTGPCEVPEMVDTPWVLAVSRLSDPDNDRCDTLPEACVFADRFSAQSVAEFWAEMLPV